MSHLDHAATKELDRGGLRPAAARARPHPRLPAQRLRVLHRHAHQGRPGRAARPSSASTPLPAWRETPFFTARERAALAFTEAVTLLAADHVPDEAYDAVAEHFSPDEVGALLSLIVVDQRLERAIGAPRILGARGARRARGVSPFRELHGPGHPW